MKKAIFVDVENGDQTMVLYIDNQYVLGHYYLMMDGAIMLLKFIQPDIEIEYYIIPFDIYENLNGFPDILSDNFIEEWEVEKQEVYF
jgi:hypothetical protein